MIKIALLTQYRNQLSSASLYVLGLLQLLILHLDKHFSLVWTLCTVVLFTCLFVITLGCNKLMSKPALSFHFWTTWIALGMGLLIAEKITNFMRYETIEVGAYLYQDGLLIAAVTESLPFFLMAASILLSALTIAIYLFVHMYKGYKERISSEWLQYLIVMASILMTAISIALVGRWFFGDMILNSQLEHFFNLTMLAFFSTIVYEVIITQFNFILDTLAD